MRACTSVLGHVLGSHPEIDGYYELHRSYRCADDLDRQRAQLTCNDPAKPGARYVFDKLLHNDYTVDLALPALADAVVLVSLRPPAPTLASIVGLFAGKAPDDAYASPHGAAQYYLERLSRLAGFAAENPGRYHYFDASLVRTDPPRLLTTLADWLALASPLSEHYQRFSQTGVVGAGDSSPALRAGQVLRTTPPPPALAIPPELRAETDAAYRAVRRRLITLAAATRLADEAD